LVCRIITLVFSFLVLVQIFQKKI